VAVLIPSIDLMGGKIVQLVQGERKALEFDDFEYWLGLFSKYPLVQVIDLDAAMGKGHNRAIVEQICLRLPCQVGGGIHGAETARDLLERGARAVVFGSALIRDGEIATEFAAQLAREIHIAKLTFAIDSRNGRVSVAGWRKATNIDPITMMRELEPYCGAFLYTNIETEGLMKGLPLDVARKLRAATTRRLIVAGGVASLDEVDALERLGVDAVVGMAIYTGAITA
jgi:phosphoribosylformimino-5-aminoimidazole carboxamide ribotide isomerase